MDIKRIIREEVNDFDWVDSVDSTELVLYKAFEFDPVGDGDESDEGYGRLVSFLQSLGFEPRYNTPSDLGGDMVYGLYAYRDNGGDLAYVFTPGLEDDEQYIHHILGFAQSDSDDGGSNLEVVNAQQFIKEMGI
jgi:hypothetical protein